MVKSLQYSSCINNIAFDSIPSFLNHGCDCPKSMNGYFQHVGAKSAKIPNQHI